MFTGFWIVEGIEAALLLQTFTTKRKAHIISDHTCTKRMMFVILEIEVSIKCTEDTVSCCDSNSDCSIPSPLFGHQMDVNASKNYYPELSATNVVHFWNTQSIERVHFENYIHNLARMNMNKQVHLYHTTVIAVQYSWKKTNLSMNGVRNVIYSC